MAFFRSAGLTIISRYAIVVVGLSIKQDSTYGFYSIIDITAVIGVAPFLSEPKI